jgi:hypothetical protein
MEAIRIKQQISTQDITIPFDRVRQFQGTRVEIIILPDTEDERFPTIRKSSLKQALKDVFEQYHDVKPYTRIDPVQWQKEIRNEW